MSRTTVLLPLALFQRMNDTLSQSGYGPREGSRWICEAIVDLVRSDPILADVGVGEDLEVFGKLKAISLTDAARDALATATEIVRRHDPAQEGVRSAIIRAAIRQRLAQDEAQLALPIGQGRAG